MNIQWLGHSCFLLTSTNQTRILIDPYSNLSGYPLKEVEADIVLSTHNHFDHSNIQAAIGYDSFINQSGEYSYKDITIKGTDAFHDDVHGAKRGTIVVFNIEIDGMHICHLGDLGHILTPTQLESIGLVDVLLIPVGGIYTIEAKQSIQVIQQLQPQIVIPMHFHTKALEITPLGLDSVDVFLKLNKETVHSLKTFELNRDQLSLFNGVVLLDY